MHHNAKSLINKKKLQLELQEYDRCWRQQLQERQRLSQLALLDAPAAEAASCGAADLPAFVAEPDHQVLPPLSL